MPYSIRKVDGKWAIVRKEDGKVVGKSDSKADALASARARMAGKHGRKGNKR
jgi:hypothetical protein